MVDRNGATVVIILFPVLATLCVAARLVARVKILRNPGWEDGIIVLSLICSIIVSAFVCVQIKSGLGRHFNTLTAPQISRILKFLWGSFPLYNLSLTLSKIAVVLQYMRVFVGRRLRIACWVAMGFIVTFGFWSVLSAIFNCVPIQYFWNFSFAGGHCISKKVLWFFNAAFNILTEMVLVALPMPMLKSLDLPKKQKIGLMCIFGLGGFICLVSILRLHSLYKISVSRDPTFDNTDVAIWSVIEMNVAIICGSLATVRPLIIRLLPSLFTSHSRTSSLPFQTGTINDLEVQEVYQTSKKQRHSRSHSHDSNVSKSEDTQPVDLPKSHNAERNEIVRRSETAPPVPEKDGWLKNEKKGRGPEESIIIMLTVRKDENRQPRESDIDPSLIV